jgi:hypothetical protein
MARYPTSSLDNLPFATTRSKSRASHISGDIPSFWIEIWTAIRCPAGILARRWHGLTEREWRRFQDCSEGCSATREASYELCRLFAEASEAMV